MLPLAAFHRALDRGALPLWTRPLLWLGLNPLAIYFASEVVRQLLDRPLAAVPTTTTAASWLFWSVLRPIVPGRLGDEWVALVYGALVVVAWTIAAGGLHRQEVRFQV
jgi:predicted acyltransferase